MRCTVGREFGAYSILLDGIRFDNRFIPKVAGSSARWRLVCIPVEGEFIVNGEVSGENTVLVATDQVIAPGEGASQTLRSKGNRVRIVGIRLRPEDFGEGGDELVARTHPTSEETVRAFRAFGDAVANKQHDGLKTHLQRALDGLLADGIIRNASALVREGASAPKSIAGRVAEAIFPLLSKLATRPMMIDLVERAGVSERQLLRDILKTQREFDLLDRGWRKSIVRWRTTAGALLLSSPTLSLDEVAELAGYSSTSAMSRAFREAQLPPPTVIRSATRDN